MKFSDLVTYCRPIKKLDTDLLLVISSYKEYDFVVSHLEVLSHQTYQKFNVLLVLGIPFEDVKLTNYLSKKKYKFGIIIAKENERRGCSGGFFTGQKYALEQGYDYVIMGDDDCMPVDRRLIEELYRNREKDYVAATMTFVEDGYRKKGIVGAPTSYSLLSSRLLKKYGLYYMPLFHGADDAEFMERVKDSPFHIENRVEHPYIVGMRLFQMFDRAWFFLLQAIIIIKSVRSMLYNLAVFTFLCCSALAFLPPYGRRLFFTMNRLLLTYTYGKKASDSIKSGYASWIRDMGKKDFAGFSVVNDSDPKSIDKSDSIKVTGMLRRFFLFLNKDVVIEKSYSFVLAFVLAMAARRLYVKVDEGKYLLFADNRPVILHAARFFVFALALPLQLLCIIVFLPIKAVCQPKTTGYGLD